MGNVTFHDHKPETLSLHDAVVDGLHVASFMRFIVGSPVD